MPTSTRRLPVLLIAVAALAGAQAAQARTITVDTGGDTLAAGSCSLRAATIAADTDTASGGCAAGQGADTIVLTVPAVTLAIAGAHEDAGHTGDLDLTGETTIQGAAGGTTISAAQLDRVLDVRPGAKLTLENLTLTDGLAPPGADGVGTTTQGLIQFGNPGNDGEAGGGIRVAGTAVLHDVTVYRNHTSGGGKGVGVTASAGYNGAGGPGGAGGAGGGVAVSATGVLTVDHSTISGNQTGGGGIAGGATGSTGAAGASGTYGQGAMGGFGGEGGGVYSEGTTTITDSVITDNGTGPGAQAGNGHGGSGGAIDTGAAGGRGAQGHGGLGGFGGGGGGVSSAGGTLRISRSLVTYNATGPGAPGGSAFGGTGGSGSIGGIGSGSGGIGGDAFAGDGGDGGGGAGIHATGTAAGNGNVIAVSDTIAHNVTGNGANGGDAYGGTGGLSHQPSGGVGGGAYAGNGGAGGPGAGVKQEIMNSAAVPTTLSGDTIVDNAASPAATAGGAATAGPGGSGATADGATGGAAAGRAGQRMDSGGIDGTTDFGTSLMDTSDTIIARNTPGQCSEMHSVSTSDIVFPADPDCPGATADPKLGVLADNGGPTQTYALLAGSPAIDAGPAAGCPSTDQRAVARPFGAGCDAGAYELAGPRVPTVTVSAIGLTSATLSATVNPSQRATTAHFVITPGTATADQAIPAGAADVAIGGPLGGLKPATTYRVVVVATNADGTTTSASQTFTTLSPAVGAKPPVITKLKVTPSTVRPVTPKHRTHRGTKITWTDSQAATTTFTVQRRSTGRRVGKHCLALPKHPTAKTRRQKHCTRTVLLVGSFTHHDRAGTNSLTWKGALRSPLAPGSYVLRARPAVGRTLGKIVTKTFTVKR